MVTVAEYRILCNDQKTTDKEIIRKIKYLEAFCRNFIKLELRHVKTKQKNK